MNNIKDDSYYLQIICSGEGNDRKKMADDDPESNMG